MSRIDKRWVTITLGALLLAAIMWTVVSSPTQYSQRDRERAATSEMANTSKTEPRETAPHRHVITTAPEGDRVLVKKNDVLTGIVLDDNERPVPNVTIRLSGSDDARRWRSDALGRLTFEQVPRLSQFVVDEEGYVTLRHGQAVGSSEVKIIVATLPPSAASPSSSRAKAQTSVACSNRSTTASISDG